MLRAATPRNVSWKLEAVIETKITTFHKNTTLELYGISRAKRFLCLSGERGLVLYQNVERTRFMRCVMEMNLHKK